MCQPGSVMVIEMTEPKIDPSSYSTTDWNLASINKADGNPLVGITRSGKVTFFFKNTGQAKALLQKYWAGILVMNVCDLLDAQQFIKTLIHQSESEIRIQDKPL